MLLDNVEALMKKDTAKLGMRWYLVSILKACISVGIIVMSDFNHWILALVLVYYFTKAHMLYKEIDMIRLYLAAFYDDIKKHEH